MNEVVLFRMTSVSAQRLIRELAADSDNVVLVNHAKKRRGQRRFTPKQIMDCLQRGTVSEGPYQQPAGEWRCNVFRHAAGEEMTVVVEFDLPQRLLVVTVF